MLVNNAGISRISRFDGLRVEDWDEMIDVNFRASCMASRQPCRCSGGKAPVTS